jgi:hypothetical protein
MDIDKTLNADYEIKMQGGSILIVLRALADEIARFEVIKKLAEKMGVDVPPVEQEKINAMEAIGHNLMVDAKKIFGVEYLNKVFPDPGEEPENEPSVVGIKEDDKRTLN